MFQNKEPINTKPEQKQEKKAPLQSIPNPVAKQIEEIMRRLRLLEERYSGVRKKSQLNEQNMLKDARDLFQEIKLLNSTLLELKGELSELNEKFARLSTEVSMSVKKTEFNVLAKYLDFWEPLNFVTREEAGKIILEQKETSNE